MSGSGDGDPSWGVELGCAPAHWARDHRPAQTGPACVGECVKYGSAIVLMGSWNRVHRWSLRLSLDLGGVSSADGAGSVRLEETEEN